MLPQPPAPAAILMLAFAASALATFESGCTGRTGPPPQVQRAAVRDLACSDQQVVYQREKNQVYKAYGCGKEATYVHACPPGGCMWRIDGAPRPSSGPPPPKPGPPPVDLPPVTYDPPPPAPAE